jgi:hypothetical protein
MKMKGAATTRRMPRGMRTGEMRMTRMGETRMMRMGKMRMIHTLREKLDPDNTLAL